MWGHGFVVAGARGRRRLPGAGGCGLLLVEEVWLASGAGSFGWDVVVAWRFHRSPLGGHL